MVSTPTHAGSSEAGSAGSSEAGSAGSSAAGSAGSPDGGSLHAGALQAGAPPTRRRGDALVDAILAATLDELAEEGFARLSIERIAERARTGKASIYRRWPTRLDLVLDALDAGLPALDELPDTGSTREDLLIAMRRIASAMRSRAGCAARACVGPGSDDELTRAIRERLLPARKSAMLEIYRRGVARGDVRPDALTQRLAAVGPMLLHGELLQRGRISDRATVAIVDEVLLPLLRP